MSRPVLLVEDNEDDIFLVRHAFKKAGVQHPLAVAQDGQKAIDFLLEASKDPSCTNVPALILLDLKMPKVPGLEFLAWLRAQPRMRLLPVVVLTSSMADQDLSAAYSSGANSYFSKPSESSSLVELLQLLDTYWLQRCLSAPVCSDTV